MAGCGGRAPPAAPLSRPPCSWAAAAAGPGRTKRRGGGGFSAGRATSFPPRGPPCPARQPPPAAGSPRGRGAGAELRDAGGKRGSLAPLSHARRAPSSGPAGWRRSPCPCPPFPGPGPGAGAAARVSPRGGGSRHGRGWAQSAMSGSGRRRRLLCGGGGFFRLSSCLAGRSRHRRRTGPGVSCPRLLGPPAPGGQRPGDGGRGGGGGPLSAGPGSGTRPPVPLGLCHTGQGP